MYVATLLCACVARMTMTVHALARKDYTAEQLNAWAPRQYDAAMGRAGARRRAGKRADVQGTVRY